MNTTRSRNLFKIREKIIKFGFYVACFGAIINCTILWIYNDIIGIIYDSFGVYYIFQFVLMFALGVFGVILLRELKFKYHYEYIIQRKMIIIFILTELLSLLIYPFLSINGKFDRQIFYVCFNSGIRFTI
jgi:hypothetical protein